MMSNCPYFSKCGGCKYPLDDYDASLRLKVEAIKKELAPFLVKNVVSNPNVYHYRHKVIYRFFKKDKKIYAGLYEGGLGKTISIENCLIQKEVVSKIIKDILSYLNRYHVEVYNPTTKQGLLRYILFRVSKDDKVSICLVIGNKDFKGSNNFFKEIRKLHPEIVNIDLLINRRDTSVVIEGELRNVFGNGYLRDKLKDYTFNISNDAFYQVNPYCAELIYQDVIDRLDIKKSDVILDAYCGIGTITLFLAKYAKQVIGVEINAKAIKSAIKNATINNVTNVSFVCQDVKEYMCDENFDILVVDPTRSGMSDDFIKTIRKKKPKKIAYVSCNPQTMANDLNKLKDLYFIEPITLYDQFGFTAHLEALTICHLKVVE